MKAPSNSTINNVLANLASPEEAELVARWFNTNEGREYLVKKMNADFLSVKEGYEELAVGHEIPSERMLNHILKQTNKRKRLRRYFAVAAVLLPLILFAGLFYQLNSKVDLLGDSVYEEIYVPEGKRLQMMFQDGSIAYINSDSRLKYPKQFGLNNRKVYLSGEAYFEIEKNSKRPFIVEMDSATIQVLGTSFSVEAYPDDAQIRATLDKGVINFIPWTKKDNALAENQQIVLVKRTGECTVTTLEKERLVSVWRNDVISFMNAPLSEVIKTLSRWYGVQFEVMNEEAYTYSYTFTSENTLLENVLKDFEKVSPVKFLYRKDRILVEMK